MSYPNFEAQVRTDADFRSKREPEHHQVNGMTREFVQTPLEKLKIDMVLDFPVSDTLHHIELGIIKRCLKGWKTGGHNFRDTKLSLDQSNEMSKRLKDSNQFMPSEFHRSIRGLEAINYWKGLEFRTFTLYLGPIVLKDIIPDNIYKHYLLLFCALTICNCQRYIDGGYLPLADAMIREYLEQYINIYGKDSININVHNLCHLVDEVKKYGRMIDYSTYPFENMLGIIINLLRNGNRVLAQAIKRITEIEMVNCSKKLERNYPYVDKKNDLSLISKCKSYDKIYLCDGFMLSNNKKNQWFMTNDDQIVKMLHVVVLQNKAQMYGESIRHLKNFFHSPIESKHLNIFCSSEDFNVPCYYDISDIKCKMVCLDFNSKLVFLPLLHTLDINLEDVNLNT